jgi:hypothetical protein
MFQTLYYLWFLVIGLEPITNGWYLFLSKKVQERFYLHTHHPRNHFHFVILLLLLLILFLSLLVASLPLLLLIFL